MPRKRTQQSERRHMFFFDQHRRKYTTQIEKVTGEPCSPYGPMFTVPHPILLPPQDVFRIHPNAPRTCIIDYRKWISDAKTAWQRRYTDILRFAKELHGNSSREVIKSPTPDILHRIGREPIALELVVAMAQGNRWALGFDPRPDVRLEKFLPLDIEKLTFGMEGMDFGELLTAEGEKAGAAAGALDDLDDLTGALEYTEGELDLDADFIPDILGGSDDDFDAALDLEGDSDILQYDDTQGAETAAAAALEGEGEGGGTATATRPKAATGKKGGRR